MKKAILAGGLLLLAARAFCAELLVPSQYLTIQLAIDAAAPGDTVVIAPGIYTGDGNRNINFRGKAITVRSTDPNDQWVINNTVIDCGGASTGFGFSSSEGANSVLDGLTIINAGFCAIYCDVSSPIIRKCGIVRNDTGVWLQSGDDCPTIANCSIKENSSTGIYCYGRALIIGCDISRNSAGTEGGGGIYCYGDLWSGPTMITDCNINENVASEYGYGGGIIIWDGDVVIDNCRIVNNQAEWWGGGICAFHHVNVKRSVISGNTAHTGGAVYLYYSGLEISDSIVSVNYSQGDGGGLYVNRGAVIAENCTFVGNTAGGAGGGVSGYLYGINSIFWGNSDAGGMGLSAQINPPDPGLPVIFSCIQDDDPNDADIPFGGEDKGNIDDDPMFVDSVNGNYHLQKSSPCIDSGSPLYSPGPNSTDIDGQPRVIGRVIDMGADEYGQMIIVARPKDSEVWATGSRHQIKWFKYGVDSVDILLSTDSGATWDTIAAGITDADSYLWELPRHTDSNQCVISVLPSDGDANVVSFESGLFTIKPYPHRPPVPPGWPRRGNLPAPDLSRNKGPKLGCIKWVFETDGPVSSQVAITWPDHHGYRIYVGCEDGLIYALNDDGEYIWSCDINTPIVGSPAVGYYGMVYVAGQDGWLYAIDDDGDLRWTHITDGPVYSTPVVGYDGKIYVCSEDGIIYAIAADGSELWTFTTTGPGRLKGAILATPAIDKNGAIYVAGLYDPNLYALDANNGSIKWVCSFPSAVDPNNIKGGQLFAPPAIGPDGTIYQTLINDTNLYAINSTDGAILWRTNLADPCSGLYGGDYARRFWNAGGWCEPAIGPDGTIYVSFDDPYLRAVRPDGSIKWVTRLGMVGGFTLSVDRNGLIYAASDDGFVCVVNDEGEEISRFEGNDWVSFPAIADDGTLIVSDSNNKVWAIGGRKCRGQPPALHIPEDIEPSWEIDWMDLAAVADSWLDCTDPYNWQRYCFVQYGVYPIGDVDRDQYVDFRDFAALVDKWLMERHPYVDERH
jgi:outer membrane protein assembly factor BamB